MSELTSLTVASMRRGLLAGDFSAKDLTEAHLRVIETTNERLNSFITICNASALAEAEAADKRIAAEGAQSPALCGIPISVKDIIVTKGIETTCAANILKGFIPPYDSTAVAKLKKAGAVILGKTNLDPFGMGSSNEHSAFGPCRNPWDEERVPGGSSGGSAVSVSAGQAPISLGTDTGGSVRQPAALCGVIGIKPTYGRISRYGVVAYASSLDQVGILGRTVDDVALGLQTVSGHDTLDSTSMNVDVPDFQTLMDSTDNLSGLRIGVPEEYTASGLNTDVSSSFTAALEQLKSCGAQIVDVSLPHTEYALATYYTIVTAEASSNLARYDGVRYGYRNTEAEKLSDLYELSRAKGFGDEVKRRIMMGSYVLSAGYYDAYYLKAQKARTLIMQDFASAFEKDCDVIAAPVSPFTAFKLGEKAESPLDMYLSDIFTVPASLAGLPAMSIPSGVDTSGLPIGLQLIGPHFAEDTLLRTAKRYTDAAPFDCLKSINN